MATVTADSDAGDRLTTESIPVIDLRLFTQSELHALSRCSAHAVDLSRCDDLVIPKIDRTVFNESAGSRKQTYSRFRLARRKPDLSSKNLPSTPGPLVEDPERVENSKIIALFKQLFNAESPAPAELVSVNVDCSESFPSLSCAAVGETTGKKRGRKPKSESLDVENSSRAMVVYVNGDEKDKQIVNKNGVVVDLVELAKLEDPFAAEISRRTVGMQKDEELLGFLTGLDGQWGSRRKRRKIVDANEFGDALPNGWKVLLGMKKKQGQCWLFCRRYISPSGRYFMSCKEVSSYLMSLCGFPDAKQLPLGHSSEASQMENKLVSVNAESTQSKDQNAFSVTPVVCEPDDYGKETNMVKDVVPMGAQQHVKLFRCHKCSTPFYEKDHLLHHLISCHKRKRRKSGVPMEDDELANVGYYECQFCDRTFTERVCFFVHVGIHVKNYMKSIDGSGGATTTPTSGVSIPAVGNPPVISEKPESMEVDGVSVARTPVVEASNGHNAGLTHGKLQSESVPKDHVGPVDHEAVVSSMDIDQSDVAAEIDKGDVGAPADKEDTVPELAEELAGNDTDTAKIKVDDYLADENLRPGNGTFDTTQTSIEIREAPNDIDEPKVPVHDSDHFAVEVEKSSGLIDSSLGYCDDGINGYAGQMASQHEMLDVNKNKPSKEKVETGHSGDVVAEAGCSEEGKHKAFDDEMMFGSGNNEIDEKLNVSNGDQVERTSADCSLVPHGNKEAAVPGSSFERGAQQSSPALDDLQRGVVEDDSKSALISTSGVDLGTDDFSKDEVSFDADDSLNPNEREIRSLFYLPGEKIADDAPDDSNSASAFRKVEPRRDGGSANVVFPSTTAVQREALAYGTHSSGPYETSSRRESNCDEAVNSSGFFIPTSNSNANLITNKEVNFSPFRLNTALGSSEAPGDSNVYGTHSSVAEESKQNRDSKSAFSYLSVGGHGHGVTGQVHGMRDNVDGNSSVPSTAQVRELSKVESSEPTNKVILEFGSSMNDLDTGVLPSYPPQTIPVSPSPFSLWNDQAFGVEQNQSRACDSTREEAQQGHVSQSSSLSLAGYQQTCNVGYNLNEAYISTMDNFSGLNPLENHRDTDLMIGFGNLKNGRANQDVASHDLWRSNEGNALPSGVGDSSSSQGQLGGAFQPFDFLSDKGDNDIFTVNEKFDSMSNFGLRSGTVEPTEFSFLTPQESNPQLGDPKVLTYANAGVDQGFGSSVWLGKDSNNSQSSFIECVWCGGTFQQDSIDADTQVGSIGYLCPTCKARMSGQFL